MKLQDTRDGTILQGELIATLPANQEVGQNDMERFYKTVPGSKNYAMLSRAIKVDRVVLRRGDVDDEHFYIVPRHDFYKEVE
jgi:hypothetical protein